MDRCATAGPQPRCHAGTPGKILPDENASGEPSQGSRVGCVLNARETGPNEVGCAYGRITRPSNSAAKARRLLKQTNSNGPPNCPCTNSAAPSWPASAARIGCRASSLFARDRTASASVTSSHLPARASNRARTSRRCKRDSKPSLVRRSIALVISVRVHSHVMICGSWLSHSRASLQPRSDTSTGTSADASQYFTDDRSGLRAGRREGSREAPWGALEGPQRDRPYPAGSILGGSAFLAPLSHWPYLRGRALRLACHDQGFEPRLRAEPRSRTATDSPSVRRWTLLSLRLF